MTLRTILAPLVLISVLAAGTASAQSLAEIARKEAERRGGTPTSGKVYTNESLTPDFTKPAEPALPAAAAAPAEPASTVSDGADQAEEEPRSDADQAGVTPRDEQEPQSSLDKDENYWRGRADRIRARLNQQNAEIADLQRRVSSFPAGAASPEHDIAVRALRKAQADLVDLNQEWLRFERQARERNIPDAWIR